MKYDPVKLEILKNSFIGITEEMGIALKKSSYSPNIKTREDHTCSIFNNEMQMVAQTAHQIGHLGAFPNIIKQTMKEHRVEDLKPGDMIIVNDPYRGGTHLPDIIVISPVFYESRLWGFVANLAHHSDVGGIAPGSVPGNSTEIFQEGIRIPSVMLFKEGKLQEDIMKMILANVRTPEERKGDLNAQVAANQLGIRRIRELIRRYGFDEVLYYANESIRYAERRMRAEIEKLLDGVYEGIDYMDDDGITDEPVKIAMRIHKKGSDIEFDLSDTSAQRAGPTNCTFYMALSLIMYTVRCLTDPDIHQSEGCYRPTRTIIPEGKALNCRFPAAVAGGWEISRRGIDSVCRAFLKAMPGKVPAGSNGAMNQITFGGLFPDGRRFAYYETNGGGFGARSDKDGMDGVHSVSNTKNTPIEELELNYPIFIRRYGLRENSEGAGKFRGGLGIVREFEFLTDATFATMSDRQKFRPWGVDGGEEALGTDFALITGGKRKPLLTKSTGRARKGDVLSIRTAGGGGYGNPKERSPEAIRKDLEDGKISLKRAREVYGWKD
ncbi:MAG: hydantoinase B/oxoprolinase family protein [Deltaproteobacteria bacterium]|nr:hydantoinase B/oxoprolinase family protein [Deltaproteobacteria bacterium]MBW2151436.1 hydantoinase B/oxoprolinase family protein [Deltaproteobacteria bacterium]